MSMRNDCTFLPPGQLGRAVRLTPPADCEGKMCVTYGLKQGEAVQNSPGFLPSQHQLGGHKFTILQLRTWQESLHQPWPSAITWRSFLVTWPHRDFCDLRNKFWWRQFNVIWGFFFITVAQSILTPAHSISKIASTCSLTFKPFLYTDSKSLKFWCVCIF